MCRRSDRGFVRDGVQKLKLFSVRQSKGTIMPGRITLFGRTREFLRKYVFHGRVRYILGYLVAKFQAIFIQPSILPYFITFFPHKKSAYSYVIRKTAPLKAGSDRVLPEPPERLWLAYGLTIEEYLESGKKHVDNMRSILADSGYSFEAGSRVMEFGCGGGRMLRWLNDAADRCEIWGTDLSGDHIVWCKQNMQPPFHFFITTATPHLPFTDGYFDLIYAGSVFTHIDDLADTWLLELRRILKPGALLYITICDNESIRILTKDKTTLSRTLFCYKDYFQNNDFGMFAIGRFMRALVFYDQEYLTRLVAPFYEVISITPEAYGLQTGVLLRRV
jgi:ubiquinone/menaquinone biosynthesis C-methylase UbiE